MLQNYIRATKIVHKVFIYTIYVIYFNELTTKIFPIEHFFIYLIFNHF